MTHHGHHHLEGTAMTTITPPRPAVLHALADLLEAHFDDVAGAIADSRNKAPRVRDGDDPMDCEADPLDRDSGDVLADVIDTLRSAS
jgi:hypothetical protein